MATIIKGKNANRPYTVRYWHENRQREKSFKTQREAKDFIAKFEHDSREHIFVDPREAAIRFADAAERWLSNHTGTDSTKLNYRGLLKNHINPAMGNRSLRSVASDRYALEEFLKTDLPKIMGPGQAREIYIVIRAVVNDAIKAGKLHSSRINGISLPAPATRANITFATHAQLSKMAESMGEFGPVLWLMRGCGLRIGEALAVRWENFRPDGTLRIHEQLDPNGRYVPLKHRSEGDFRDIPVPGYVRVALFKGQQCEPGDRYGYVWPDAKRSNVQRRFNKAKAEVDLPSDFTPHTLRHIFASVSLSNGIPITDVSKWLGHRNINMTFSIYGHLVPSSTGKARHILQDEYDTWKETS